MIFETVLRGGAANTAIQRAAPSSLVAATRASGSIQR